MKAELIRVGFLNDGTFGVFVWEGVPVFVTVERPWLDNKNGVSCIPVGKYSVLRCSSSPDYGFQDSQKFGDTFQVFKVPGRSFILFHKGNIMDDSRGCIIVGERFETLKGKVAVLSSGVAFKEFKGLTNGLNSFQLTVRNA